MPHVGSCDAHFEAHMMPHESLIRCHMGWSYDAAREAHRMPHGRVVRCPLGGSYGAAWEGHNDAAWHGRPCDGMALANCPAGSGAAAKKRPQSSRTLNPQPRTQNPEPWTLGLKP